MITHDHVLARVSKIVSSISVPKGRCDGSACTVANVLRHFSKDQIQSVTRYIL